MDEKWGEWAFLLGVFLAIVVGLFAQSLGQQNATLVAGILVILGLIVGFLNISEKEVNSFLIAAIALLATSASLGPLTDLFSGYGLSTIGDWIRGFVGALSAFVSPAAIIVALKAVYSLAAKK